MLGFSQFDASWGHYMFVNESFNPAAVGNEDGFVELTAMHRITWVGIPNAGQTTFVQAQLPFVFQGTKHAFGVKFLNESVGLFNNKTVHLQYCYKFDLGEKGVLSAGADLGFVSLAFKGDSVKDVTSDYHDILGDVHIPQSHEEDMAFDMSLGMQYMCPNWYFGVSYSHLTNPKVQWDDNSDFTVRGIMYFTGGYNFRLANPNFVLRPSALFKTDFATWQCDASLLLEFKERYKGGLSYRIQDALAILLGFDINEDLSLGYAYEIPTSRLGSWGSHEIYLTYGFNILKQKKNSKYKNVRIL